MPFSMAAKLSFRVAPGPHVSSACSMALPQACVTAMASSSIFSRSKPTMLPSDVATRLASPMKSPWAWILSSASWARGASGIRRPLADGLRRLAALLAQAPRGPLQLDPAPARGADAVVDGATQRVLRVAGGLAGAAGQLDRARPQGLHLLAPRARGQERAGDQSQGQAHDQSPAETTAA